MKKIFEMCIVLTMMLFVVNAGIMAFEDKIFTGENLDVNTDTMIMAGLDTNVEEFGNIGDVNALSTGAGSSIQTEGGKTDDAEETATTVRAESGVNLVINVVLNFLFGYQTIFKQIFPTEISFIINSILTLIQVIGGIYLFLVLASLVRGGYNPG